MSLSTAHYVALLTTGRISDFRELEYSIEIALRWPQTPLLSSWQHKVSAVKEKIWEPE